jgi:type II secretory pathway predicted ATPase ExeA/septal ring-binding cell division protein DamX
MYLSHFGLSEPPFRITPHTDFFFDGANRGATLEALLYAILNDEGIVKVSGEVGSGKTMLCRVLLERLPAHVETIYLATPSFSRDEIFRAIAEDLKVDVRGKRTTLLLRALQEHLIQRYAEGRRVVVLIDEAHAMPPETLEEIRLLSNLESNRHKLLQIVLFGQPELDEHLASPGMRQLRERITHSFRLEPLIRKDIDSYIDFRMRAAGYRGRNAFAPAALRSIAAASKGLTRRINILSDKALLAAFADSSHEVTAKHARAAIKDCGFGRIGRPSRAGWLALAGAAAGALLVLAVQFLWPGSTSTRSAAPATASPAASPPPAPTPRSTSAPPAPAPSDPGPALKEASTAVAAPPVENPARPAIAPDGTAEPTRDSPSTVPAPAVAPSGPAPARTEVRSHAQPDNITRVAASAGRESAAPTAPAALADSVRNRVPAQGALARDRFIAAQGWLQTESPERFSIQLLTANQADIAWMENFLQRATESVRVDDLYVYSWKSNGRHNYRVALGSYSSPQEAVSALSQLPPALKAFKPYPESIAVIRRLNAEE